MVPCGVRMAYVKGCEAMRIAIISDIHGNCVALDAVLADQRARAPDQVVCLGDAIQGGRAASGDGRAAARTGLPGGDGQCRRLAADRR